MTRVLYLLSLASAALAFAACQSAPPSQKAERAATVHPVELDASAVRPVLPPGHQPLWPRRLKAPRTAPAPAPATAGLHLEVYDVRDLVSPRTTFLPPVIRGLPTGYDDEPRFPGEAEDKEPFVQPDVLVFLVQEATDPGYWTDTEGASIEVTEAGFLLVRAHDAIHRRIGTGLGAAR